MVRFRQWDEILQQPAANPKHVVSAGIWHYARGMAYASKGQVKEAQLEIDEIKRLTPEMIKIPTNTVGTGNAERIPVMSVHVIEAKIALSQKQNAEAIAHLEQAVDLEDAMDYNEPPDWIAPVRETLGGMLLQAGDPVAAEKVFRSDLDRHPRNPRSLFGLMESLKAQGRTVDAQWVQRQFEAAWTNSDTKLRIEDL
jgi:tetratricopeptide (TPR) repeat protein